MAFGDLSLLQQILVGLIVPPLVTVLCWFGSRRMVHGQRVETQNKAGFWAMLIAAYLLFALALYSSRFFAGTDRADPSDQMVQ